MSATGELVGRFANRFHRVVIDGSHTVTSPLGAWLLLALVAPAATGAGRDRLADVLGTDVDDATARAAELLERPHRAVASATVVWARRDRMLAAFDQWTASLSADVMVGGIPTPREADAWADAHTLGMIPEFPVACDDDTVVVLANALATRVEWSQPFARVASSAIGGGWADRVATVLEAPDEHRVRIVRTEAAGDVALHAARSTSELLVLSAIAAPDVEPWRVLAAVRECVPVARRKWGPAPGSAVSLFDLPLGDGPAWTIREESRVDPASREQYRAWLPAWTATGDHDLLDGPAPGFDDALAALVGMVSPEWIPEGAARQVAFARYGAEGFEASAITEMAVAVGFMPSGDDPEPVRIAEVRFAHPYAVIALAEAAPGPWDDMPVFSAWVTEPTEA